jgi:hypothetical protein
MSGLGLNAFLQLTSPTIVPTLFYWGFPLSEAAVAFTGHFYDIRIFTPAELQASLTATRITQDPSRGMIGVGISDCLGSTAAGVQMTFDVSDPLIQTYYGATTEMAGVFAMFDVPPGYVNLTATPPALTTPSSHVSVLVRAGTLTEVYMAPTP